MINTKKLSTHTGIKTIASTSLVFGMLALSISMQSCSKKEDAIDEKVTEAGPSVPVITMNYYSASGKDSTDLKGAISVDSASSIVKESNGKPVDLKISGEILQTCSVKGCWMELKMANGKNMRVKFKDYAFFVPKEGQAGLQAVVVGKAKMDTTTIADLKHFAEDAGKSAAEIAKITEPEVNIGFEATVVGIAKN